MVAFYPKSCGVIRNQRQKYIQSDYVFKIKIIKSKISLASELVRAAIVAIVRSCNGRDIHLTKCSRVLRDAAALQFSVVARSARGLWLEQVVIYADTCQ